MKKTFSKILKTVLFILPVLLGTWGMYFLEGEPLLDSIFNSVLMYFFCYTNHPANLFIEAARWLAPAVTASGVVLLLNTLRNRIVNLILYCTGKSIAVYGPEEEKEGILKQIKGYGYAIDGKEHYVPASKYILLNDEEKNFAFYNSNKTKLKNSSVYLKTSALPSSAVCDSKLHLFCAEETSARLFWKENFLYPLSLKNHHQMEIVFIGFEKLGEELLLFGLQNNIFSPDQKITYHIFGEHARFKATHKELTSISDPVLFYDDPWYLHLELIDHADIVVVLTQENQTSLLRELLSSTTRSCIHTFAADVSKVQLLYAKERLHIFDWKAESQKLEHILNDVLFEHAKQINLRYAHLYSGVEETKEAMESEWKALDSFTRYSNVSSADYHEVRSKMLEFDGKKDKDLLSDDVLEIHAELEHIRWCRYHYLNNWIYGIPANGKNKDMRLRIHKDLIPYQKLTEEEKEKDRENIRILHSVRSF